MICLTLELDRLVMTDYLGFLGQSICINLPLLSGSLPINDELMKRFVTFAQQCVLSDSSVVSSVARFALAYDGMMNSAFGRNVVSCCAR